jgi:hypothetical protein
VGSTSRLYTKDEKRILELIAALPWGSRVLDRCAPLVAAQKKREPITLSLIADYLECLSEVLREVKRDSTTNERELAEMREEYRILGRFLARVRSNGEGP